MLQFSVRLHAWYMSNFQNFYIFLDLLLKRFLKTLNTLKKNLCGLRDLSDKIWYITFFKRLKCLSWPYFRVSCDLVWLSFQTKNDLFLLVSFNTINIFSSSMMSLRTLYVRYINHKYDNVESLLDHYFFFFNRRHLFYSEN